MSSGPILYPNITSLPGSGGLSRGEQAPRKQEGTISEFDQVLDKTIGKPDGLSKLENIKEPLKFSGHAVQRLRDRKIHLDGETMAKVNNAIDMAETKGVADTLVLTKDAALIVSVKNRTVVTAMDRNALAGNVFTNIDGAVIVG
jgi:flagellar operon protein